MTREEFISAALILFLPAIEKHSLVYLGPAWPDRGLRSSYSFFLGNENARVMICWERCAPGEMSIGIGPPNLTQAGTLGWLSSSVHLPTLLLDHDPLIALKLDDLIPTGKDEEALEAIGVLADAVEKHLDQIWPPSP